MIDPLAKIKSVITAQREDLAAHLTGGGAQDYAQYSKMVGAMQALDLVMLEVETLEERMLEE